MEIIQPAHNKRATAVKNWKEIRKEALEMRELVNADAFEGNYGKAFAISNAQVSDEPKMFFVLHRDHEHFFGTWCVINQKLAPKNGQLSARDLVEWQEACMSFPFRNPKRVERFNRFRIKYNVPFLMGWRSITRDLEGLAAFIAQHEAQHSAGTNIYGLGKPE